MLGQSSLRLKKNKPIEGPLSPPHHPFPLPLGAAHNPNPQRHSGVTVPCRLRQVSRLNYGGAICIGVTDADAPVRINRGGWSCGFNPYCGAFFVTGDAYKVNYQSPAHNLMHGDLQGKANKAAVTVMVH